MLHRISQCRSVIRRAKSGNPVEPLEQRVLLSGGDLDPSFGVGGRRDVNFSGFTFEQATSIDVANGRVVIGGKVSNGGDTTAQVALTVLDGTGKLLTSFSGDGRETEPLSVPGGVIDLVVQKDNKIVVLAGTLGGPTVVARFNPGGSVDTAFGQHALPFGGDARAVALAPNGDVVVVGRSAASTLAVARFSSTGASKGFFATSIPDSVGFDVAVQPDGKVVAVGVVQGPAETNFDGDGLVVRVKADMSGLDTTFSGDGIVQRNVGPTDSADAVTVDGSGRVLVGFVEQGGFPNVLRFLNDGSVDPSFATSRINGYGGFVELGISDLAVAPSGKITVSGSLSSFEDPYVARFNTNGGFDTTFGGGDGIIVDIDEYEEVSGPFHDVQTDGKIITVGADFAADRHLNSGPSITGEAVLGADGVLRVTGTSRSDNIGIADYGTEDANVSIIVINANGRQTFFERELVSRVEFNLLGGDDQVENTEQRSDTIGQLPRIMNGGAGNDILRGGSGKDRLLGADGNDQLFGGENDDVLDGSYGADLFDGGLGADTVDYSLRGAAVYVDLEGDADDGPAGEKDRVAASIEHIWGGKGNDILIGDSRPNFIRGNGGNDTIAGRGGNDTLKGDGGVDKLYGDDGDDFLDALDGVIDGIVDGGIGTDTAKKDNGDPIRSIEQLA